MKDKTLKSIFLIIIFLVALAFIVKFGGPATLRLYIETGIGNCQKIPILCMAPEDQIAKQSINKEYLAELLPYNFPQMAINAPKGFTIIKEKITKVYYKKRRHREQGAVIYLLYQEPNFFVNLFPQVKNQGIKNDYDFLSRTMFAKLNQIKNLNDAFFVIMKGIFIPDLGDPKNIKMAKFRILDKQGFINYSLTQSGNYFDGNIINRQGDFFKVYIKDWKRSLSLEQVLAILSTVEKTK